MKEVMKDNEINEYTPTSEDIFSANYEAALKDPNDEESTVSAAAELFYAAGDNEAGDALRKFNAVTDFDEDGDNTAHERAELMKILSVRKTQMAYEYVGRMSDEDVVSIIGKDRRVTEPEGIDYYRTMYNKGSFYDPDIFGGDGKLPMTVDDRTSRVYFGRNMGYIELPFYCINPSDTVAISFLLGISIRDVENIAKGLKAVMKEDIGKFRKGQIVDAKDIYSLEKSENGFPFFIGGDGLYYLLSELHYPAHPENLCFKILPVLCPALRPASFNRCELKIYSTEIERYYENILRQAKMVETMVNLDKTTASGVPYIIIASEVNKLQSAVSRLYVQDNKGKNTTTAWSLVWKKGRSGVETQKQLMTLYRKRFSGYTVKDKKTGNIDRLHVFPFTVKVRNDDGTEKTYPFKEIAEENEGIINSQYDECIIDDDASDEEKKRAEEASGLLDKMEDMQKNFCIDAARNRDHFIVKEDPETGMYINVQ